MVINDALTVTTQVAVLLPLAVFTVMVAVPGLTAVTRPFTTVATAGSLLLQVTVLLVALLGVTVKVKVPVAQPTVRLSVFRERVTPVTDTVILPLPPPP